MNVVTELVTTFCPTCGINYAVPRDWKEALSRRHDRGEKTAWFCPNGHPTVFSREPRIPELERDLARARQENARLEELAINTRREAQAEIKRQAKRSAAGVCPCCHRTFRQLALHMRNKHPDQVRKLLPAPTHG